MTRGSQVGNTTDDVPLTLTRQAVVVLIGEVFIRGPSTARIFEATRQCHTFLRNMRQRFGTVPLNFTNGVIGSDRHLIKSYFKVQYDTIHEYFGITNLKTVFICRMKVLVKLNK